MNNKVLSLFLIFLISFGACSVESEIDKTQLFGKWSSYSSDIGYAEYEIDESSIGIFSHYMGNLRLRKYTLEDNLLIIENDLKFRLTIVSDSVINLESKSESYTLNRISNSSLKTFHSIDSKNDSIFNNFYQDFEKRAYQEMKDRGLIDTLPEFTKIEK